MRVEDFPPDSLDDCPEECPNLRVWYESHPYGSTYALEALGECEGDERSCPLVENDAG